jgi:hypothetical protein
MQVRALQLRRQTSELFLTPASSLTSLPDSAAAAAAQGVSGTALQVRTHCRFVFRLSNCMHEDDLFVWRKWLAPLCNVVGCF